MKISLVAALIFSVLNVAQAAELCSKDSEGNWKTAKGSPCYMGQQRAGQPASQALPLEQRVAVAPAAATQVVMAAPASIASSQATAIIKTWQVEVKDVTLANTFTRWAESSGQKVRWDAERHILVEAPDTLTGSFEDVVTTVLSSPGIAQGTYPLEVCFYPNNPPLARITRKGEQKECK